MKKEINDKDIKQGNWDGIHIVVCNMREVPKVSYKVISTVMLSMQIQQPQIGFMEITGSSSKQMQETHTMPANVGTSGGMDLNIFHISNIGRMIEANEGLLRQEISEIYINKQRNITNTGRLLEEYMSKDEKLRFTEELARVQ